METLRRILRPIVTFLVLTVMLTATMGLPGRVSAGCGAGVSWNISSQSDSSQSSDSSGTTTDTSERSQQTSSDGQSISDEQTHHQNPDGSSHDHEQTTYTDSQGTGCSSGGEPWSGQTTTTTDTDVQGNRKVHHEELINKNGKCTKLVVDEDYDKNNKLVSHTEKETEVQCSNYSLQVSKSGTVTVGNSTVTYGPNTMTIPLERNDKTYTGNYEGVFDDTTTGECQGFGTFPVTYDVTATEDEFGDLDFTIKTTVGMSIAISCGPDSGGSLNKQNLKGTLTFTLPEYDGASKTYGTDAITTFTLRLRNP